MIVIGNKSKNENIGKAKSVFKIDRKKSRKCPAMRRK